MLECKVYLGSKEKYSFFITNGSQLGWSDRQYSSFHEAWRECQKTFDLLLQGHDIEEIGLDFIPF